MHHQTHPISVLRNNLTDPILHMRLQIFVLQTHFIIIIIIIIRVVLILARVSPLFFGLVLVIIDLHELVVRAYQGLTAFALLVFLLQKARNPVFNFPSVLVGLALANFVHGKSFVLFRVHE